MDPERHIVKKLERHVSALDGECGQLAQMILDREFSMAAAVDLIDSDNGRSDEDKLRLVRRVLESGMRPEAGARPEWPDRADDLPLDEL